MKLLLKLLLSLSILIAAVYVATPLWLPYLFARQLPPGWQLEKLQTAYPGFSGISINLLRVKGETRAAIMALKSTDVRFNYRGLKTEIDSLSLDVHVQAPEYRADDALTLDKLSLPITKLTGRFPELSISDMKVVLHQPVNIPSNLNPGFQTLTLDFQAFRLFPREDNNFHLTTDVSIMDGSGLSGQIDVDVRRHALNAKIRFPADTKSPPWLSVSIEQTEQALNTTTRILAVLDTEPAQQQWLEEILAVNTGGMLTRISGKLLAQADFAGKDLQSIEHLSLTADRLQADLHDGTLIVNATGQASREGETISVTFPKPAEIQYQDTTGIIDELINGAIPGLQRTSRPLVTASANLGTTSNFVFQAGTKPSIEFNGDVKLGISANESSFDLRSNDLQIDMDDFSKPGSATVNGLIDLNWVERAPFVYTYNDENSQPMILAADEASLSAEITSQNSSLISSGDGVFIHGSIEPLAVSAEKVDMSWKELDLLSLAGKFSTRTQGFATEYEGDTWTGFDLDISYNLLNKADISGSGVLAFDAGPDLPIVFAGHLDTDRWDIKMPLTTIRLTQLESLLDVAHFKLPESVKLTDGFIDFQGDVRVNDVLTANMVISGYELGASMLESSARKASFIFNTNYANKLSANGPVSIETVALAGGIDVSRIRADLEIENKDRINLRNLYAEIFDGQLSLGNLHFSENRFEDTRAELSHINLGHLLEFADIDGLEGSGHLDISLPAGSDLIGVYIRNGTFSSSGPGHLAYTKEGVAGSNIGLQALENFQYQGLSGTVDYQSDGNYQIGVRLEGKNPDLYGGHPIVFNLNISGSLPELFEALFITGNFEESILKEIRSR